MDQTNFGISYIPGSALPKMGQYFLAAIMTSTPPAASSKVYHHINITGPAKVQLGDQINSGPQGKTSAEKAAYIRNKLFISDPSIDRQTIITARGDRVPGTCEWILENATFQQWHQCKIPLLWISGGPGKGKTMMSIFLTEQLEQMSDEGSQVIYFFCRNDDLQQNMATNVLRGLLWQILGRQPALTDQLEQYFEGEAREKATLASSETLWSILTTVLKDHRIKNNRCILDGLDECDSHSRDWLVKKFNALFPPPPVITECPSFSLVIVSREMRGLQKCARLKLDPDHTPEIQRDIQAYVAKSAVELFEQVEMEEEYRKHVEEELLERADDTFLWVGFAMEELRKKATCLEIAETLAELPPGLPSIYRRMLLHIDRKRSAACADILKWVTLAFRPLSVRDLAEAIDIPPVPMLSKKRNMRELITLTGPILTVENEVVSLVHQSARDYLLDDTLGNDVDLAGFRINANEGHLQIARTCVEYLEKNGVSDQRDNADFTDSTNQVARSFVHYAVQNWPNHAAYDDRVAMTLLQQCSAFFDGFGAGCDLQKQWWREFIRVSKSTWTMDKMPPPQHIACYLGLHPWAQVCMRQTRKSRKSFDTLDSARHSMLHYAVEGRHENMAQWLIRNGVDLEAKDHEKYTALHFACRQGNETMVRLLLDHNALVHAKNLEGMTSLHVAILCPSLVVANQLLEHGAPINARDCDGETPLAYAALYGHEPLVSLLLETGAHTEIKGAKNQTALHTAADGGYDVVTNLLLGRADVAAKDVVGYTPLHLAALRGHAKTAQVLLEHGADSEARDDMGWTPLDRAGFFNHEAVARVILEHKARSEILNSGVAEIESLSREEVLEIAGRRSDVWEERLLAPLRAAMARESTDIGTNQKGDSKALHLAGSGGRETVARWLDSM